jgi:hypothetical protein
LLTSVDDNSLGKAKPCDIRKLTNSLKLRKACGLGAIPNEYLRHFPRTSLVYLTHLFRHYIQLSHFPMPWKKAKVITLPKTGKDPKLSQNFRPISLSSTTGKILEKVILKIVQRYIGEKRPA